MGGRAGGGARSSGGGAGNDFARDAVTHPLIASMQQKTLNVALASVDANIKDPKMRAEMKAALEKMHAEMGGLPSGLTVHLGGNMDVSSAGRPNVWFGVNQGNTITLNKKYMGKGYDYAAKVQTARVANGTGITTNKPGIATFVHEVGHGYYSGLSSAGKAQVASLHASFKSSGSHKGWGTHSSSSPAEFYADAVAKSVLGTGDKWTKALGKIR